MSSGVSRRAAKLLSSPSGALRPNPAHSLPKGGIECRQILDGALGLLRRLIGERARRVRGARTGLLLLPPPRLALRVPRPVSHREGRAPTLQGTMRGPRIVIPRRRPPRHAALEHLGLRAHKPFLSSSALPEKCMLCNGVTASRTLSLVAATSTAAAATATPAAPAATAAAAPAAAAPAAVRRAAPAAATAVVWRAAPAATTSAAPAPAAAAPAAATAPPAARLLLLLLLAGRVVVLIVVILRRTLVCARSGNAGQGKGPLKLGFDFRQAGRQAGQQAGRQAGRPASRQAGRQAGRQASRRQACSRRL